MVAATQHDKLVWKDYERIKELGILTAREGLRWHLIEAKPGKYDFASVMPFLQAAQEQGIQLVWDLLHFGWPDHLQIFDASFVDAFGEFASQAARVLKRETSGQVFVAPVNEISFVSWAGGDKGFLNPFARDRGPELKRQLVRGYIRAAQAVRAEISDSRLVSP